MEFAAAQRSKTFARVAVVGPSGSGKTYGALQLARGLVGPKGRIALVDTEQHSAALYATLTPFDVTILEAPFSPARYCEAIRLAVAGQYDVLIIDSLSHGWFAEGGVLDIVDQAAKKTKGNRWAGWSTGTPAQQSLITAILAAPLHVIATMRAKTEWVKSPDSRGKMQPQKIGMGPVQRDGIEFEFTTVFELDEAHTAITTKDRTSVFDGRSVMLSVETGEQLRAWLHGNAPELIEAPERAVAPPPAVETAPIPLKEPGTFVSRVVRPPPADMGAATPICAESTERPTNYTLAQIGGWLMDMAGQSKDRAREMCKALLLVDSLQDIPDLKAAGEHIYDQWQKWQKSEL